MTITDIQSWADNLQIIWVPDVGNDIAVLQGQQISTDMLLTAKVQEFGDAIHANIVTIGALQDLIAAGQSDIGQALVQAGQGVSRDYVDQQIALLRADMASTAATGQTIIQGNLTEWLTPQLNNLTPTLQAQLNQSLADVNVIQQTLLDRAADFSSTAQLILNQTLPSLATIQADALGQVASLKTDYDLLLTGYNHADLASGLDAVRTDLLVSINGVSAQLSQNYLTAVQVNSAIAGTQTALQSSIDGVSANLGNNYYTKVQVDSAIVAAQLALQATNDGSLSSILVNYYTKSQVDTAISAAQTTLQSNINGVSANLTSNYYTTVQVDDKLTGQASLLQGYANAASLSATNAATSASNASTSASQAASSKTDAANSAGQAASSASAAAGSATAASTSAANASTSANQASTASTNAANSASGAASSATAAATSATNAASSASSASTSATSAASSKTDAANSAGQAATSASAASTSATSASTSAGNASVSATNAASASSSATSAQNAAISAKTVAASIVGQGIGVLKDQFLPYDSASWLAWTTAPTVTANAYYALGNTLSWNVTTAVAGIYFPKTSGFWTGGKNADAYQVEIEFELASGSLEGAGVAIDWNNAAGTTFRSTMRLDAMVKTTLQLNQKILATGIVHKPAGFSGTFSSHDVLVFVNDASVGTLTAKSIKLHRVQIQPLTVTDATVETQSTAIADLQGKAAAAITMRAKAGTSGAQLELVAASDPVNGAVSTARIAADNIILDGSVKAKHLSVTDAIITGTAQIANGVIASANIGDLQVSTVKIADRAVTIPEYALASTTLTLSSANGWYELLNLTILREGMSTLLRFNGQIDAVSGTQTLYLSFYRDGVAIGTVFAYGGSLRNSFAIDMIDTDTGTGNTVYSVRMNVFSTGSMRVYQRFLSAHQYKK